MPLLLNRRRRCMMVKVFAMKWATAADGGDGYGDSHGGAYGDCQLFAVIDPPLHKMCSIRGSNIKQSPPRPNHHDHHESHKPTADHYHNKELRLRVSRSLSPCGVVGRLGVFWWLLKRCPRLHLHCSRRGLLGAASPRSGWPPTLLCAVV